MKKLSLVATATLLLFSLTACSDEKKSVSNKDESTEITETKKSSSEESSSSSSETEVSETSSSSETAKEPFDPASYPLVDFNAWNHDDVDYASKLQVTGTVIQAMKSDEGMNLRLAINDDYDQVVLITIEDTDYQDVIAEDDNVTVYGLNAGLTSYKTVMGNEQTIPAMLGTNYTVNSYGQ